MPSESKTLDLFFDSIEGDITMMDKMVSKIVGTPGENVQSSIKMAVGELSSKWVLLFPALIIPSATKNSQLLYELRFMRDQMEEWRNTETQNFYKDIQTIAAAISADTLDVNELISSGLTSLNAGAAAAAGRLEEQVTAWKARFPNLMWSKEVNAARDTGAAITMALDQAQVQLPLIAPTSRLHKFGSRAMKPDQNFLGMIRDIALPQAKTVSVNQLNNTGLCSFKMHHDAGAVGVTAGGDRAPLVDGNVGVAIFQHGSGAAGATAQVADETLDTFRIGGFSVLATARIVLTASQGIYSLETVANENLDAVAGVSTALRLTDPSGLVHNLVMDATPKTFMFKVPATGAGNLTYTFVAGDYFDGTTGNNECRCVYITYEKIIPEDNSTVTNAGLINTTAANAPRVADIIGAGVDDIRVDPSIESLFSYIRLYSDYLSDSGNDNHYDVLAAHYTNVRDANDAVTLPVEAVNLSWYFTNDTHVTQQTKREMYSVYHQNLNDLARAMSGDTNFHDHISV
jgi:hypothetical protein